MEVEGSKATDPPRRHPRAGVFVRNFSHSFSRVSQRWWFYHQLFIILYYIILLLSFILYYIILLLLYRL